MNNRSRIDLLIYAHDGRGIGHISRSVAIGLATRRLFPNLKIAVLTGSPFAQMLVGTLPLEILKLPSYQVLVKSGESYGTISNMNIADEEIADLRSNLISGIVDQLKPRCILVDHLPLGKRNELEQTLSDNSYDCLWILGLRAVLGRVSEYQHSSIRILAFKHIFWYGDSDIIPNGSTFDHLSPQRRIHELGYVSRAFELEKWGAFKQPNVQRSGITISFSWLTKPTSVVLSKLADIAEYVGDKWGQWHVFLGKDYSDGKAEKEIQRLASIPHCSIEPFSDRYLINLSNSRLAIVSGGYNTLTDLIWAGIPSLILVRNTQDAEQIIHVGKLANLFCEHWIVKDEEGINKRYMEAIITDLYPKKISRISFNIKGSENAAVLISELLS